MHDIYKTIDKPSEGLYKDKGSRFIGYAFNVNTEDDIKGIIKSLKKDHHAARHCCYAWRLGANNHSFRVFDDGEPSSSAGKPILGQIQSFDLTNILIVVIRYFGGTLLGVSGLIDAYRNAALDAIKNAQIVEKLVEKYLLIEFDYSAMNDIMKIFKDEKLTQIEAQFDIRCKLKTCIRLSELERIEKIIEKIDGVSVKIIG